MAAHPVPQLTSTVAFVRTTGAFLLPNDLLLLLLSYGRVLSIKTCHAIGFAARSALAGPVLVSFREVISYLTENGKYTQ